MATALYTIILFIVNAVVGIIGLFLTINGGLMAWSKSVATQTFGDIWNVFINKTNITNKSSITHNIGDAVLNISSKYSVLIFVIGLIILLICGAGIIGTCCKSSLCLKIYMGVIFIVILSHIIILIVYFSTKHNPKKFFIHLLNNSIYEYKNLSSGDPTSVFMGLTMIKFNCCGVNNGSDFKHSKKFINTDTWNNKTYTLQYPIPCCKFKVNLDILNINNGCLHPLHNYVFHYIDIAAYVSIIILLCEVIILLMATLINKENSSATA
ncbi:unnamed protein product [Heterobilharzia americana]|nr:unnamed protein product [Heterobilharzia americana]